MIKIKTDWIDKIKLSQIVVAIVATSLREKHHKEQESLGSRQSACVQSQSVFAYLKL